jgi:hypothetical protein
MNREDVIKQLHQQSREERIAWGRRLGQFLTIAARSGYPIDEEEEGSIRHLMGFNEIQHQLYQYVDHFEAGTDWGLEVFLDSLNGKAETYGVEGDFRVALSMSLRPSLRESVNKPGSST